MVQVVYYCGHLAPHASRQQRSGAGQVKRTGAVVKQMCFEPRRARQPNLPCSCWQGALSWPPILLILQQARQFDRCWGKPPFAESFCSSGWPLRKAQQKTLILVRKGVGRKTSSATPSHPCRPDETSLSSGSRKLKHHFGPRPLD
jgi:hypothetical protein